MANIERQLSVLDQICSRLDKMEKNYGKVDTDMLDCKNRISNLEKSAQFLSNIHDEHKALKYKVDSINSGIETNKSDNKVVRDRLIDIEAQNLRHNLLFFALDEQPEGGATGSTGGVTRSEGGVTGEKKDTENCTDKILDFCENLLRIENAKTNIKIEKAFRLGKKKMDATKPRPIVVKFGKLEDREMVRSISNRLKGSKFGISPHYPQDVLERRKKLIPRREKTIKRHI